MGHSNSNPLSKHKEILKDYILQQSSQDLSLSYLTHKYSGQKYVLREYSLNETKIYEKLMQEMRNRLYINNKSITKLIKYEGEQVDNICSKFMKIYSLWQYTPFTISMQIARRSTNRILAIIIAIIEGLYFFYSKSITYQSFTSQSILISNQSLKIIDPLLMLNPKNHQKIKQDRNVKGVYISPQQCQMFQENNLDYHRKQNDTVFVAGVVILEAALLEKMNMNYEEGFRKINWKELGEYIRKFQSLHGRQLALILKSMLEPQSSKRPKFEQLLLRIKEFDNLAKSREISRVNFSRSLCLQRQSNMPISSPLSVSTAGHQSSRVQNSTNNYHPHSYKILESKNTPKTKITMNFHTQNSYKPAFLQEMATINLHTDINNNRSQASNFCHQLHTSRMSPLPIQSKNNLIYFTQRSDAARPNVCISQFDSSSNISEISQTSLKIKKYEHTSRTVIEKFKNGSQYSGQKVNGVRSGWGKYSFQDGGYYEGQWKDSKMHGYGRLYYKSQKLAYDGSWDRDLFSGKGKLYNQYPVRLEVPFEYHNLFSLQDFWSFYQGQFYRDNKQGKGILMLTNGQYYEGQFKDNQPDGQGYFYTLNGQKISGTWKKGIL